MRRPQDYDFVRWLLPTFILALLMISPNSHAKDFPAQGRLFAGSTQIEPNDVNEEMEGQGLKNFDNLTQLGIEITTPLLKHLDVGMRYTYRQRERDEAVSSSLTDFAGEIRQDSILLLARIPFLRTKILRLDAFAGVGGNNTTLKFKTSTQEGELAKREANDWVATPYFSYGGSLSLGYKWIYLVFETGIESNKVKDFERIGNVNSNVGEADLSGAYFTLGLMFDGIKATKN